MPNTPPLPALPPLELTLIGIGAGNPAHLTGEAAAAMRAADLILLPHKGEEKAELAALRQGLCDAVLKDAVLQNSARPHLAGFDMPVRRSAGEDYLNQVDEWHAAIAGRWQATIAAAWAAMRAENAAATSSPAAAPLAVALLVWGDPALYDSTLRIAARLHPAPQRVRVVPGITAMQALAAAHAIAFNAIGQPFTVTTGRQLREQGWPSGVDTAIVMLDGQCSFTALPPALAQTLHIWWGAYLGMPQQILDSGPLLQAGPRIQQARARARQQHGWIMDTYLLRRTP